MSAEPTPRSPQLFTPYRMRELTLRNRVMVSPMCQYSATDGLANDWHFAHLGAFATGGAALVMTEATAVEARGRISPEDLGIWRDEQIEPLRRIVTFLKSQGAVPGIQLAHAGRKASTLSPWNGNGTADVEHGGWPEAVVAPSALAFTPTYPTPRTVAIEEIPTIVQSFADAARRSLAAGFEIAEIHAAHGYLLHQFLSPDSNHRTDAYGGDLAGRARLALEVTRAVRAVWPAQWPLFVRMSATDWLPPGEGFDLDQAVRVATWLREAGADLIDVSSGGLAARQRVNDGPGYQVPFAERIRHLAALPVAAVGRITEPEQAEAILRDGQADLIAMARVLLRDPHWPLRAAHALGGEVTWPKQYQRARWQ